MSRIAFKDRREALAALVLRLALGTLFLAHGAQKLFGAFGGGGIQGAIAVAAAAGFQPAALWGPVLALSETLCALAFLLGFYTRAAALLVMFEMGVAVLLVHLPMGYFNSRGGFEFPLTVLLCALALFLTGSGAYSLDMYLELKRERRAEERYAQPAPDRESPASEEDDENEQE